MRDISYSRGYIRGNVFRVNNLLRDGPSITARIVLSIVIDIYEVNLAKQNSIYSWLKVI